MEKSGNQSLMTHNGTFLTFVVSSTLFFSGNVLNNKNIEDDLYYLTSNASEAYTFNGFKDIANNRNETNKEKKSDYVMTMISAESREVLYMNDDNHLTRRDYDAIQEIIDSKKETLESKIESSANNLENKISKAKIDVITEIRNNKKFTISTWISIISCLAAVGSLMVSIYVLLK